ncbi:hypothetical protein J1N35_011044 [Gossypium stocksii]|uniref:Uncharacterized protein n=1 Tax=Gossypium stocksii TaxID=47602 RepID=A0A9D3W1J2_9ROSI|nr:hypothetical protein J1N35_011044 [Gossypium stocksii]
MFEGIIIGKKCGASRYNRHNIFLHFHTTSIFNLLSSLKANIAMDARELLGGKRLFRWSKGDAPFGRQQLSLLNNSLIITNIDVSTQV